MESNAGEILRFVRGWFLIAAAICANATVCTAVAEQFTYFGTVQIDGLELPNPTGQYENSFITQFVAGYSFTPRLVLQVNVPFIYPQL